MPKILPYSLAANVLLLAASVLLFLQGVAIRSDAERMFGARQQFGMPGIFNLTAPDLESGEGTALNTDSRGRLITSTSSQARLSN